MDWAVYTALIASFLAVSGAMAFLVVRILRGWRDLKRARRHLARALGELATNAERTSTIVERISDQGELETTLASLRRALARLSVLRAAVDEVGGPLLRLASVYPRT